MTLNCGALALLILSSLLVVYGIVGVWSIPYSCIR
jgi:hypothetical protein